MTVEDLLTRMGSRELAGWMAKDRIDPPPDPWLIAGVIASTIANSMTSGRTWLATDFMPSVVQDDDEDEDEGQSMEDQKAIMMAYVRAGKVRIVEANTDA